MTTSLASLKIDDWGRLVASCDAAVEILMSGKELTSIYVKSSPELSRYNEMCVRFDKPEHQISEAQDPSDRPQEYHRVRSQQWITPLDDETLWDDLFAKCKTDAEQARFILELEEFGKRGMLPVLVQLHHMIKTLDEAGVVRGVGRGSSVASFILYLMEVHFINPMSYDLEVTEFLR